MGEEINQENQEKNGDSENFGIENTIEQGNTDIKEETEEERVVREREEEKNKKEQDKIKAMIGINKTAEYLKLVEFVAIPYLLREKVFGFSNEGDFAKEYNLNPNTLTVWKKKEDFWDRVKKQMHIWGKGKTPQVLQSLYERAIDEGRASEVKLWLEYFEQFTPKQKIEFEDTTERELTDEEKELLDKAKGFGRPAENIN